MSKEQNSTTINVQGHLFEIDDYTKSPLLQKIFSTQVPSDRDENGNITLEVDPFHFYEYTKFLNGKEDFTMSEQVAGLFQFMGHENHKNYELNYWKATLYGNELVQVPMVRESDYPVLDTMCIAGGYALYLSGYTQTFGDIDHFCFTPFETNEFHFKHKARVEDNESFRITRDHYDSDKLSVDIQVVKKVFGSIEELFDGFDLDICRFAYHKGKLWSTRQALYAAKNRIIRIVNNNLSTLEGSYMRLYKYSLRGFNMKIPSVTIDKAKLTNIINEKIQKKVPIPNYVGESIEKLLNFADHKELDVCKFFGWCEVVVLRVNGWHRITKYFEKKVGPYQEKGMDCRDYVFKLLKSISDAKVELSKCVRFLVDDEEIEMVQECVPVSPTKRSPEKSPDTEVKRLRKAFDDGEFDFQ